MKDQARYRIEDLRKFAAALAGGVGLAPVRAAGLASHLLWYDLAGAPQFGLARLPDWLERMAQRQVDPRAEGKLQNEHASTAVLDGKMGVTPLVLAQAAAVASDKARELGAGLVRVVNVGPSGPATAIASEIALGPQIAWLMGPGPCWTLALPAPEGLPAVYDPWLTEQASGPANPPPRGLAGAWALLAPDNGWLVAAVAVNALEPLATFHERISTTLPPGTAGLLARDRWDATRADAREHGLAIAEPALAELKRWAGRLSVHPPAPIGT